MTTQRQPRTSPGPEALAGAANVAAALAASFARHRDRPALEHRDQVLTYAQLDDRTRRAAGAVSARLAGAAHRHLVQGPTIVAVVLDPSVEFITAILGVVWAGAAYLPVDAHAPDRYIDELLTDARPALVVTDRRRARRLRRSGHAVLVLDELAAGQPAAAAEPTLRPDDPAYVIYTSGSTGTPKGVVVGHGALLASTAARLGAYGVPARIPLVHSVAFDLTSGVAFWALLTGGTLVISPVDLRDVAGTLAMIDSAAITHLVYPAGLYAPFLERAESDPPTGLQAVMIGSERWSSVLIDRHARLLPRTSLYNEYGPTEASVWCSYACVYDAATGRAAPLTIGQPLPGVGFALHDGDGQPPGVGEVGELYITGVQLAQGYLHRPDLTAERFVALPTGERGYRTGDLVRRTAGGDYEFVGRADRQLKVQGNRIEAGHVETALMSHPAIAQAHVEARPLSERDPSGASTLVVYLVARTQEPGDDAGAAVTGDELRSFAAERLPGYMVPSSYIAVAHLPRTANGKIDPTRLPAADRPQDPSDATAPADRVEAAIAALVADALECPDLPLDRSLLDLGANSLACVSIATAISTRLGVDVPISAVIAAPSVRDLAAHVRDAAPIDTPPVVPGDRTSAPVPLSPQQRQIWVLHHLEPDSLAYNTQFSLRLRGRLDVAALEAALAQLVARHEILRTTFHDSPAGPVQVVHDPWPVTLEVDDLTELAEGDRDTEMTRRARAVMHARFDVGALPLVRWRLYKLAEDTWSLLHVEHHFAHDGWSASLLLGELRDTYRALAAGRSPALAAPAIQYRDYARWHQQWQATGDFDAQARYWLAKLDGCPATGATFETDHPRPVTQRFRGDCLRAHVPAATVARIDELCERHGLTRFAAFLTAFALLAWRHTGETDLVIGSALSNRRQAGTAGVLGMFVNALPLRLRFDPDASVLANAAAVMATVADAQDHQEFPLIELVRRLDLPRDPARNPLFGLMFAFHDSPRPPFETGELTGELRIEHNGSAKNDLNVVCVPTPPVPGAPLRHDGMDILWEYDTDLYQPETAQRLLDGFLHVLAALPDLAPDDLGDVDLLDHAETAHILHAGHGPRVAPPYGTLHAGVDARIATDPDATAVIHGEHTATYRELDAHARAIQARLASRGVGPGAVVGVACPPSIDHVATCLAVLRAGAAYVCVDDSQPPARLQLLAADAEFTVVVTTRATRADIARLDVPAFDLEGGVDQSPAPVTDGPPGPVGPDQVVYLTYTSGSTGEPKAVVTSHANAVAALHARTSYFGATPPRTLVTLPPIFDVAGSMTFWTLSLGGTVVFPDDPTAARDPDQVRALVERHHVTHLNFTASYYREFLLAMPQPWRSPVKVVAIGGESCTPAIVNHHAARLPDAELHNEYGPTEATVWCAATRLYDPTTPGGPVGPITVGRPLANYALFALDDHQRPVPVGATGQLYVGGAGCAVGYLARPELTRQAFVTPTTGPLAGVRLYRTGDRARLLANGHFAIAGRVDDQVKIRGYRIEPGEIERCLTSHPDVTAAAVVRRTGTDHLVAYVATPRASEEALVEDLSRWVGRHLPAYMAPAVVVPVADMPRTATGKIDRTHLPEPSTRGHSDRPLVVATDREDRLLGLVRAVLQQPDIGVDDDLFAAGADSLDAIRLTARARAAGLTLPVPLVVQARTVRALAQALDHPDPDLEPAAARVPHRQPGDQLPLTAMQGWFFDQDFAEPDHFNQAHLIDLDVTVATETVHEALRWTISRHDAFRTRFEPAPVGWRAVLTEWPPDEPPAHIVLAADEARPDDRLRRSLDQMHTSLDVAGGPLWRAAVIADEATGRRWLALVIHHLLIDAVSWDILRNDLDTACERVAAGDRLEPRPALGVPDQPPTPPDPAELAYWRHLAEAPKPPRPTATGASTYSQIRSTERRLSFHATRHLLADTPRLYQATSWSTLLAATAEALAPLTGTTDLYAFIEGHGRDRIDGADEIVGWLTALYPVLLRPGADDDLAVRAARVEQQLAAVPHGGVGFGLARHLDPGSPLGRIIAGLRPPGITINYLGQTARPHGRALRSSPLPTGTPIGARNVLPTPVHLTASTACEGGALQLRWTFDPAVVDGASLEAGADRLVALLENAAHLVALGDQPTAPGAPAHLFVHPVGGRVHHYAPLARRLGRWHCLGLAQPAPASSVDQLAATHATAITERYLHRIDALTGWSFGAIVAYELARRLEAQGRPVRRLTLLDPPSPDATAGAGRHALAVQLATALPDLPDQVVAAAVDDTAGLPDDARLHKLLELLPSGGQVGADPVAVHQIATILGNHSSLSRWQAGGDVEDLHVIVPRSAGTDHAVATARAWQARARTPITVTVVAGDHHSMLTAGADQIAEHLHAPDRP